MTLVVCHLQPTWRVLNPFQASHEGTTSTPTLLQLWLCTPISSELSPQYKLIGSRNCLPNTLITPQLVLSVMAFALAFGLSLTQGTLCSSHSVQSTNSQALQTLMMSQLLSCSSRGIRR